MSAEGQGYPRFLLRPGHIGHTPLISLKLRQVRIFFSIFYELGPDWGSKIHTSRAKLLADIRVQVFLKRVEAYLLIPAEWESEPRWGSIFQNALKLSIKAHPPEEPYLRPATFRTPRNIPLCSSPFLTMNEQLRSNKSQINLGKPLNVG